MKLPRSFKWDKANHWLYVTVAFWVLFALSVVIAGNNAVLLHVLTVVNLGLCAGCALVFEVYQNKTKTGQADPWDYITGLLTVVFYYVVLAFIYGWIKID